MAPTRREWMLEMTERWMRDWIATWRENRFEMLGIEERGRAMLVDGRWHLLSKEAGGGIPLEDFTIVLLFRDERAERPHRMAVFFDRKRAVQVASAQ